ncbi:MAG: hypothetical protein HY290_18945 [Planctomycetia bacterium]|nr:hypothetical protein [Planctomycetia bacterium]
MISESSSLKPSTRRPVPLHRRADLVVERIDYQLGSYFVIKDPLSLKYFRLGPEQYKVLELMDGTRSLEEVRDRLLEQFPYVRPSLGELQLVVIDLHAKGLVYSGRPGQGQVLIERRREARRKQIVAVAMNILSLRLPGWDPESFLKWLHPKVRWLYRPPVLALHLAIVAVAYLLLATQFDTFRTKLPEFRQFFGWPNLMYLYLTIAVMKVLHEVGHGMTCRHFGGECHEIGVIFLVFSPTLYCDVSDSWMMHNKWKRIAIGAAGMWVESVLSSLALIAWWFTHPGLLHHLCLNVFFISSVSTVLFNANPLMRYDGYYMLSDFLEIPNLAEKARVLLQNAFASTCLGIETKEDAFMPQRGRGWLVTYAVASAAYRWLVLFGITLFLYTVLKPYAEHRRDSGLDLDGRNRGQPFLGSGQDHSDSAQQAPQPAPHRRNAGGRGRRGGSGGCRPLAAARLRPVSDRAAPGRSRLYDGSGGNIGNPRASRRPGLTRGRAGRAGRPRETAAVQRVPDAIQVPADRSRQAAEARTVWKTRSRAPATAFDRQAD